LHSSAEVSPGKSGTKRILIELSVFLLLSAASAFMLRPLQIELLRRMTELRDSFISQAEAALGMRIEYRSMGPSLFRAIDLRDVGMVGEDGLVRLSVKRLRVEYSLLELLRGSGAASVHALNLDKPVVNIDAERDAEFLRRLRTLVPKAEGQRASGALAFAPDARFRVRGGSFSFTGGGSRAFLEDAYFEASLREGRFSVSSRAELEYEDARLPDGFERIRTAFSIRGDAAPDFGRANFSLTVPRLETPLLSVARQSAVVSYAEGTWDIRKAKDRAPFDIRIRYAPGASTFGASLVMEGFMPRDSVRFHGPWTAYEPLLASRLSGQAEIDFASKDRFSYRFDLRGSSVLSAPLSDVAFDAAGSGDQRSVAFRSASLASGIGSFSFGGRIELAPFRPSGILSVAGLRLAEGLDLDAVFRVSREGEFVSLSADALDLGELRFDSFGASVKLDRDILSFAVDARRTRGNGGASAAGEPAVGRLGFEGSYAMGNPYLQATLSLESVSAADILTGLRPLLGKKHPPEYAQEASEKLSLTAEVFLTTDLKDVSFNVPRLVASYRGSPETYAVMALSGTKDRLAFREITVHWPNGAAGGDFSVDFADPADIAFSGAVTYRNIRYAAEGLLLDGRNLSFTGDYGLAGNVIVSEEAGVSGSVSVDALPLPIADYRFSAGASAAFRYASPELWSVSLHRFSVEETGGGLPRPLRVSFRADADQAGARLQDLSVEDAVGRLAGDGSLDWKGGFSATSAALRLADQLGQERYDADAALGPEGIRVRVYGAGVRGAHFFDAGSKMRATGEVRARWRNRGDYEADVKVADFRTELNAEEYRISGSGRISPDSFAAENVQVAGKAGLFTVSSLAVDRAASKASLNVGFRGFMAGREAETSFTASVSFAPFSDWANMRPALERGSAAVSVGRTRYAAIDLDPFELTMRKDASEFAVDGGPQNSLRLRFDSEGAFFAALSAPSPIRANIIGTIKNGMIDARANNLYLDFASLWSGLNLPNVVFSSGIAAGSLSISGPISDPDFFGTAAATGFRAVVPAWVPEEIGPVAATVVFDGKEFSFGPVPVSVKKGGGTIRGRFFFDRWIPFQFDLRFDVSEDRPVPVKSDVAGIVARGFASGGLSIVNDYEKLTVSGRMAVENTTIRIDYDSLMAAHTNSFRPMGVGVDLELVTGKKVEFVWPSSDYPVLRGYADIGDSLRIAYDGLTGRYSLLGDIDLRGGEVFYVMRSFYIRDGSIRFNENELRVDPRLSLRAEIRDRNEEGPVTIALLVDEAPLSSFVPRFESTPPLSQTEIFSMLGQNVVGTDVDGSAAQTRGAVLTATSDVLAQFNVVRVFERNIREFMGLDMFSVRTQLIQNAFLSASGLIETPVDRNAGLGNYFDNTTVYMGKFFGSDIFLQGMLTLQVNEANARKLLGGLSLETELGIEWKTPFFLLRWDFSPDIENNAEKLFINDHSFTFIWRKTF
jgi:translocation and assembly module TamB